MALLYDPRIDAIEKELKGGSTYGAMSTASSIAYDNAAAGYVAYELIKAWCQHTDDYQTREASDKAAEWLNKVRQSA